MNEDQEFIEYEAYSKRMQERFPKMYGGKYGGFAIGKGWYPLIEELSYTIQSHIDSKQKQGEDCPQVVVQQVKEKFGTLRFYYNGGDEFIHGAVWLAESMTSKLCEECGGLGKQRNGGWVRTLCDVHEAEYQKRIAEQAKKDGLEL
jgi:hypothetical protein